MVSAAAGMILGPSLALAQANCAAALPAFKAAMAQNTAQALQAYQAQHPGCFVPQVQSRLATLAPGAAMPQQQPQAGVVQPPPQQGFTQQPQAGYAQQPQPGFTQQPQAGYAQQPQQGLTQQPQAGYAQQPQQGFAQQPQAGYAQQPQPGVAQQPQAGFAQQPQQGFAQQPQAGFAQQPQQGFAQQPQAGFAQPPQPRVQPPAQTLMPQQRAGNICDQLWYARNAIFDRAGYCFSSARGKAAFDNTGCTGGTPDAAGMAEVARIQQQEAANGC
jgi:hypothetical protein